MNIENHMHNSKKYLDLAQTKLEAGDYDSAISCLAVSYSNVRRLLEEAWRMKREAHQASHEKILSKQELNEQIKWIQSQGGISSEGFGR